MRWRDFLCDLVRPYFPPDARISHRPHTTYTTYSQRSSHASAHQSNKEATRPRASQIRNSYHFVCGACARFPTAEVRPGSLRPGQWNAKGPPNVSMRPCGVSLGERGLLLVVFHILLRSIGVTPWSYSGPVFNCRAYPIRTIIRGIFADCTVIENAGQTQGVGSHMGCQTGSNQRGKHAQRPPGRGQAVQANRLLAHGPQTPLPSIVSSNQISAPSSIDCAMAKA